MADKDYYYYYYYYQDGGVLQGGRKQPSYFPPPRWPTKTFPPSLPPSHHQALGSLPQQAGCSSFLSCMVLLSSKMADFPALPPIIMHTLGSSLPQAGSSLLSWSYFPRWRPSWGQPSYFPRWPTFPPSLPSCTHLVVFHRLAHHYCHGLTFQDGVLHGGSHLTFQDGRLFFSFTLRIGYFPFFFSVFR